VPRPAPRARTIANSAVYEASSANKWTNQPTGITGVANTALAAINVNGTKLVYTVTNSAVYEASSANKWTNQPTGITASIVAGMDVGGIKNLYTL
jgi:hypothetical protein